MKFSPSSAHEFSYNVYWGKCNIWFLRNDIYSNYFTLAVFFVVVFFFSKSHQKAHFDKRFLQSSNLRIYNFKLLQKKNSVKLCMPFSLSLSFSIWDFCFDDFLNKLSRHTINFLCVVLPLSCSRSKFKSVNIKRKHFNKSIQF